MDTLRSAVAVLAVITYPAGLVFWVVVHRFIAFWRARSDRRERTSYSAPSYIVVGWGLDAWQLV